MTMLTYATATVSAAANVWLALSSTACVARDAERVEVPSPALMKVGVEPEQRDRSQSILTRVVRNEDFVYQRGMWSQSAIAHPVPLGASFFGVQRVVLHRYTITPSSSLAGPWIAATHLALAAAWEQIDLQIASWVALTADWDSEGGIAPSSAIISNARSFVALAKQQGLPSPEAFIASDGEVGMRWSRDGGFASISYPDDESVVVYARAPGSKVAIKIDVPWVSSPDLTGLYEVLRKFV